MTRISARAMDNKYVARATADRGAGEADGEARAREMRAADLRSASLRAIWPLANRAYAPCRRPGCDYDRVYVRHDPGLYMTLYGTSGPGAGHPHTMSYAPPRPRFVDPGLADAVQHMVAASGLAVVRAETGTCYFVKILGDTITVDPEPCIGDIPTLNPEMLVHELAMRRITLARRPQHASWPDHGIGPAADALAPGVTRHTAEYEWRLAKVLACVYLAACGANCGTLRHHVEARVLEDEVVIGTIGEFMELATVLAAYELI